MINDEFNSSLVIHDGIAKKAKKRRAQNVLLIAIALACALSTTAFLIYFIITFNLVGIISFGIFALCGYGTFTFLIIKNREKIQEDSQTIALFIQQKGDKNALAEPALDVFCVSAVKVMFVLLSAVIACSIPLAVTILQGQSFVEVITYLGACIGAFWGVGQQDFYTYIIGVGLMAGVFGIILLIVKFIFKILK